MNKIIRHAQSTVNAGQRISDPREAVLSDLGRQQALKLTDDYTSAPDLVIVSDAPRTKLTVAPLLKKFPGVPVRTMPIYEFYFIADYRIKGTTPQERRALLDEYFRKNDPNYIDGKNCESFNAFIQRVIEVLDSLEHLENTLMVSHGHFINGVRQVVEGRPLTLDQFASMKYVDHCEGVVIKKLRGGR